METKDFTSITQDVEEYVHSVLHDSSGLEIQVQDLRALVSSVTQLYAACCENAGGEILPVNETVSPTDAAILACALIRAYNLNPFDLALWFSRRIPDEGRRETSNSSGEPS